MIKIAILGSTGSIGQSALSLVDLYPERLQVVALAAGQNSGQLYEQCVKYRPALVALSEEKAADELARQLPGQRVASGLSGVNEVASLEEAEIVLSAITGAAGLVPTYHAVLAGKKVALANKEALVTAGDLLVPLASRTGAQLIPVDSEHSALHQCLRGAQPKEVGSLLLTASGGPFFNFPRSRLAKVTVREALRHPTWSMGPKITVDSATLMNKGLEVIEAHHFFQVSPGQISVVIHPQSVIHSIVRFIDGTLLAQMSITDMRSAILYAIGYPERWKSRLPDLDLFSLDSLEFHRPDTDRFPCLRLAYEALEKGATYPAAINAANEVAVDLFLKEKIGFLEIPELIEAVLEQHTPSPVESLEVILRADRESRAVSRRIVDSKRRR